LGNDLIGVIDDLAPLTEYTNNLRCKNIDFARYQEQDVQIEKPSK
jgi:hypothetical protein